MSIRKKLFLFLTVFSSLILLLMALMVQWSIDNGMVDYVNKKEISAIKPVISALELRYKKEKSWDSLIRNHQEFRSILAKGLAGTVFKPPQIINEESDAITSRRDFYSPKTKPPHPVHQVSYALLHSNLSFIVGHYPSNLEYSYMPIYSNEHVVGYLAVSKRPNLTDGYEFEFIESQKIWVWSAALFVLFLILLISFPLAKHLVSPILRLREAIQKTKHGDFVSVPISTRDDEFSELYRDYNRLVCDLQSYEQARKHWLANISHELRTPIAIVRGDLEALLDKVRPLTMDNIRSLHEEVMILQGLTEDLHTLNSAEIGGMDVHRFEFNLVDFINTEVRIVRSYLLDAGINVQINQNNHLNILVFADPKRIRQLMNNIFVNVVKYAGATQITIDIRLEKTNGSNSVVIEIEDNGNGVPTDQLPMLFDPLFRVDPSRNRSTGGTGLGLAICANIVRAHQGLIHAYRGKEGGLGISISIPLSKSRI